MFDESDRSLAVKVCDCHKPKCSIALADAHVRFITDPKTDRITPRPYECHSDGGHGRFRRVSRLWGDPLSR